MSATAVRERPILFSGPMVRAILAGSKTQTRRVVKPQHIRALSAGVVMPRDFASIAAFTPHHLVFEARMGTFNLILGNAVCPYGVPGDRLWVRETWKPVELEDGLDGIKYAADDAFIPIENTEAAADRWIAVWNNGRNENPWRPSIHMPRWASRLTLEVVAVRVERVRDISAKDIIAEGVVERAHEDPLFGKSPVSAFDGCVYPDLRSLWCAGWVKLNGAESWKRNDWVWVVEFRRVEAGA